MTALDPALCARLIAVTRTDDETMTPGPWEVSEDSSAATLRARPCVRGCAPQDPVDVIVPFGRAYSDARGIARTRNNLRALAGQLEAALAEVANKQRGYDDLNAMVHGSGDIWTKVDKLLQRMASDKSRSMAIESRAILERDAALAEAARLKIEATEATEQRDVYRDRSQDLAIRLQIATETNVADRQRMRALEAGLLEACDLLAINGTAREAQERLRKLAGG